MGPPAPPRFTPRTKRRFYDKTGQGTRGRPPRRRDLSRFSSRACEKKTMARSIPTPACLRGEIRLTYGGAYAKLSSATWLITNHRLQTLLTFFLPQPPRTPNLFSPFLIFFYFFFLKQGVFHKGPEVLVHSGVTAELLAACISMRSAKSSKCIKIPECV